MTKAFFEKIITPYIKNKSLKILDAPCGIGHISYFLNKIFPHFPKRIIKMFSKK